MTDFQEATDLRLSSMVPAPSLGVLDQGIEGLIDKFQYSFVRHNLRVHQIRGVPMVYAPD